MRVEMGGVWINVELETLNVVIVNSTVYFSFLFQSIQLKYK